MKIDRVGLSHASCACVEEVPSHFPVTVLDQIPINCDCHAGMLSTVASLRAVG